MALHTVQAAAKKLGLGVSTLYDLARRRKITHRRIGAGRGRLMFTDEDLQGFLDSCKVEAGSLPRSTFTHTR